MKYLKINATAVAIACSVTWRANPSGAIAIFVFALAIYLSTFQIVTVIWNTFPLLTGEEKKVDAETLNILFTVGLFTLIYIAYAASSSI